MISNKKLPIVVAVSTAMFSLGLIAKTQIHEQSNYKYTDLKASKQANAFKSQATNRSEHFKVPQNSFQFADPAINKSAVSSSKLSKGSQPKQYADYYISKLVPHLSHADSVHAKGKEEQVLLKSIQQQAGGVKIAKYGQTINGIEVIGREINILMDKNNRLVASSGYLALEDAAKKEADFLLSEGQAFQHALQDVLGSSVFAVSQLKGKTKGYSHHSLLQTSSDIELTPEFRTKKVWYDARSSLLPAYFVEVSGHGSDKQQFGFSYVIDANSGAVLLRKNLVQQEAFNYRVFSNNTSDKSLLDGPQGHEHPFIGNNQSEVESSFTRQYQADKYQIVTLESAPFSQNDPWLADNATTTKGNNVDAYLDISGNDGFNIGDITAEVTSTRTFDYAYDPNDPLSTSSRKAAVVNLFYMNNWLHDWFYDSGFNEESGNAQLSNYGRGGVQGDALKVEGQDAAGRNNANMLTPADGSAPRMQMFLFDGGAVQGTHYQLTLTGITGLENPVAGLASFGPQTFDLAATEVVALEDGTAPIEDGCEAATNAAALVGKIALVDRGACNFTQKVINAKDAGAVGVILANNRDATVAPGMGGSDAAATLPIFSVSQNDGATIRTALAGGVTAAMQRTSVPDLDGTYDNLIVAHEWGHYISNRLVGNSAGLDNQQGRSMGEGWGDFIALLTFATEQDANIAGNELYQGLYPVYGWVDDNPYFGIRRVPYTTNFDLNSFTFKHIQDGEPLPDNHPVRGGVPNSEVHASGEIWAVTLWEIYTRLINDSRYTFKQAQDKMKEYLVTSLKMTPNSPTFTEARNAWLAAALAANEQEDYQLMLEAFAKRGMGAGSSSPDRNSTNHQGVVESFEANLATFAFKDSSFNNQYRNNGIGFCSDDNVFDVGETALITVMLVNTGSEPLQNIPVQLTSSTDITVANDGLSTLASLDRFASAELTFEVTLNAAQTAEEVTFNVEFPTVDGVVSPDTSNIKLQVNYDFGLDSERSVEDFENIQFVNNDWSVDVNRANSVIESDIEQTFGIGSSDSLTQFLRAVDNPYKSDVSFVSPSILVGDSEFSVSFQHGFSFEEGSWDGAVIEVSIDDGAWQDVLDAGAVFTGAGYNGVVSSEAENATNPDSPIDQRKAFVNESGGIVAEGINFGTSLAGSNVKIRFRQGTDANTGGFGWLIDNINFTGHASPIFSTFIDNLSECVATIPAIAVRASSLTADEGTSVTLDGSPTSDPENDPLTFDWQQTSGPTVTLANSSAAVATFSAPQVSADTVLTFSVTATDGTNVSESAQVTVNVKNRVPTDSGDSGGGGSTSIVTLLGLAIMGLFGRRKKLISNNKH